MPPKRSLHYRVRCVSVYIFYFLCSKKILLLVSTPQLLPGAQMETKVVSSVLFSASLEIIRLDLFKAFYLHKSSPLVYLSTQINICLYIYLINRAYLCRWSYGILLWEIFTYGGNPYPGVENKKVFDLLKDGYRMPRPEHCPAELYQLMRRCWEDESYNRPDFTAIRLVLEDIIEKTTQVTYLNLESGIASCDEEYEGSASTTGPNLPPRRKLPQIPIEAT